MIDIEECIAFSLLQSKTPRASPVLHHPSKELTASEQLQQDPVGLQGAPLGELAKWALHK